VQNYFYYALTQQASDPVAFLTSEYKRVLPAFDRKTSDGGRFMWCIAPLCHAAGRKIYRRGIADFVAVQPALAVQADLAANEIQLFDFVPVTATPRPAPKVFHLDFRTPVNKPSVVVFYRAVSDIDYQTVMERVLMNLMRELDAKEAGPRP